MRWTALAAVSLCLVGCGEVGPPPTVSPTPPATEPAASSPTGSPDPTEVVDATQTLRETAAPASPTPALTPSPPPAGGTPTPLVSGCLDQGVSLAVEPIPGNHTASLLTISAGGFLSDPRLRVIEGEHSFDVPIPARPAGRWQVPLFGLLPSQEVTAQLRWQPAGSSDACATSVIFTPPSVDPMGMPSFDLIAGEVDPDLLMVVPMALDEQTFRIGWLRGAHWVSVLDLVAVDALGRRVLIDEQGRMEILGEAFTSNQRCQVVTLELTGRVVGREMDAVACHHSFADVDVDGDGAREHLFLGVAPTWEVTGPSGAVMLSADTLEWPTTLGPRTLLDYADFIDPTDCLLVELAKGFDPYNISTQLATYANTLQCAAPTEGAGDQCLAGLNLAATGLVHVDLGAREVHVVQNRGLMTFPLDEGEGRPGGLVDALTWTGLEKLGWNPGSPGFAGPDAAPFAGLHSAQVVSWDPQRRLLRLVGHDRGFNMEVLLGSGQGGTSPTTEGACAQTVSYELDYLSRQGRILDARAEALDDGRCAHSLYIGDVNPIVEEDGQVSVTSFYTGYPSEDPRLALPPMFVTYRLEPSGALSPVSWRQGSFAPAIIGFHTTITIEDLNARLAVAGPG